jgi:hypothetical protein
MEALGTEASGPTHEKEVGDELEDYS